MLHLTGLMPGQRSYFSTGSDFAVVLKNRDSKLWNLGTLRDILVSVMPRAAAPPLMSAIAARRCAL
jgi:hypothetical protein